MESRTGWGARSGLTLAFGRGRLPFQEIGKGTEMGLEGGEPSLVLKCHV